MKYLLFLLLIPALHGSALKEFEKVKEVFETKCLKCHSSANAHENGGLNMETFASILKGGNVWGPGIKKGDASASPVYYLTILPPGKRTESKIMPPDPRKPLNNDEKGIIKKWIDNGAFWPKGAKLKYRLQEFKVLLPSEVYKSLVFKDSSGDDFSSYSKEIPGSKVEYSMVPIKGGSFQRNEDDFDSTGPKKEISVNDFWMGKYEVTWDEYEQFLYRLTEDKPMKNDVISPLVSHPTEPYVDMTFGMGKKRRPAICITQLAAKAYCVWLSAKTGHFYRLPTEAEWEYAARAGKSTKYYWGDNLSDHRNYEWFFENSADKYNEVGLLKANPYGLHDMLGNVSEWCLDSYSKNFFKMCEPSNPLSLPLIGSELNNPMEATWPTKLYGRIVRGGNYNDDAVDVTVQRRLLSNKEWKQLDPQLPKSVWWMTDSTQVGFRIVRSRSIPKLEDLHKYWPRDDEIKAVPKR